MFSAGYHGMITTYLL